MSYNISFSIAAAIIGIVLVLIMSLYYSSANIVNKRFKFLLIFAILMTGMDILTVWTNDHANNIPSGVNYFLNGLYFFLGALTAISLLYYSVSFSYVDVKKNLKKVFFYINVSILFLYLVSLIVNGFTGIYFNFDGGVYNHGPVYYAVNNASLIFVLESVVMFIIRRKRFNLRQIVCTTLFFTVFFISYILQALLFNDILLTDFGTLVGALIVFFSLETPDYIKLTQTLNELNELKASLEVQVLNRTQELDNEKQSYKELTIETLSSLAELVDAKDHYTNGHSFRVAAYAKGLARQMDLPPNEVEQIYFAGLIHDVGKIGISETILRKPGKLTPEEYQSIQSHAPIGGNILSSIKHYKIFEEVARSHHEKFDGTGYPDKLKGDEIPYAARIVAVCDTFDAMTSDRSYRKALSDKVALDELRRVSGSQLDPELVDAFIEFYYIYDDSIRNHIDELEA